MLHVIVDTHLLRRLLKIHIVIRVLKGVVQGINCLATHSSLSVAGDLLLTCPHLLGAA
jgi:hypothetical protein